MKLTCSRVINIVLVSVLLASMSAFSSATTTIGNNITGSQPYEPWADINDDGIINIIDATQIGLRWMGAGTPLDKAYLAYDSGWVNITEKLVHFVKYDTPDSTTLTFLLRAEKGARFHPSYLQHVCSLCEG